MLNEEEFIEACSVNFNSLSANMLYLNTAYFNTHFQLVTTLSPMISMLVA